MKKVERESERERVHLNFTGFLSHFKPWSQNALFSLFVFSPMVFFFLIQLDEGGGKDLISSLLSSLFSFMSFIAFVAFWTEVYLVLLTFDEVLSVVLDDLSHLKLQLQCFGFSTAPFLFAAVLPALVAIFVVVLKFSFLKVRSTFLRWFLPPTRLSTALTGAPATRRYQSFLHLSPTRRSVAPTR